MKHLILVCMAAALLGCAAIPECPEGVPYCEGHMFGDEVEGSIVYGVCGDYTGECSGPSATGGYSISIHGVTASCNNPERQPRCDNGETPRCVRIPCTAAP